jgi:hypothetical protein
MTGLCFFCSHPLMPISFNGYCRLVCDNDSCKLFREGQGNIVSERSIEPKLKEPSSQTLTPKHQAMLERCRNNYHLATSLGIGSVEASHLRYKSKAEIEKMAKWLARA